VSKFRALIRGRGGIGVYSPGLAVGGDQLDRGDAVAGEPVATEPAEATAEGVSRNADVG